MPELAEPAAPSRTLGIVAFVIALFPLVAYLLASVYPAIFPGPADGYGWLFLIGSVLLIATPLCGLAGLILGIIAVRRDRGRVWGIVAIVAASLALLYSMLTLVIYAMAASVGAS